MRADFDAKARPPDWAATRPGSPCLVIPHTSPSDTASFLDNHIARNPHSAAIWKTATQHRRSLAIRENSRTHISRRGRGRACTSVRFWEYGWEDLRDGCAAFLVFRVGSARTLMSKDAPPRVGARRRTPHRGGTHTMKVPPLSERPDTEEEQQDFPTPTSRRKKRSLAATRAALRPWSIGIGLTVLVAVAAVGAYTLGASISSWNDRPSTAATPTVHPAPIPSVSSEPPMSGGYAIGPDGVLVRPAQFAADTYTKPELPEAAKENTERGAEAAAEHFHALMGYAWNTGDIKPIQELSDPSSEFSSSYVRDVSNLYANGWAYGSTSEIVHVLKVEPIAANGRDIPPNTIIVAFQIKSTDGTICRGQKVHSNDKEYESTLVLFMTWTGERWVETQGTVHPNDK